MNNVVSEVKE